MARASRIRKYKFIKESPNQDKNKDKMPLTILVVNGEKDCWTNRWGAIPKNLDPKIGTVMHLEGSSEVVRGEFSGAFRVVKKGISTEIYSRSSGVSRDVVRVLYLAKKPLPEELSEETVWPFTGSYALEF